MHGAPHAEIHLTDSSAKNLDAAGRYASQFGVADRLHLHLGDALRSARRIEGPLDIILCDIDKHEYPAALDFAAAVLPAGGVLIFDNMLWRGEVAKASDEHDAQTAAVVETTRRIYADAGWLPSLLPVRDGVLIALRTEANA